MKKIYLLFFLIFGTACVWGQVLTENFSYTAGTLLTANGWTAHSGAGTNSPLVTSPSLTYASHPGSGVGNAVTMASTSGEDDNKSLSTAITTGTAYASFLVNVTTVQATGDYFIGLLTTATSFPVRVYARTSGAGFNFGISKAGTSITYEATVRTLGTTYFIVTNYIYNAGVNDDAVNLWVNPALGAAEPAATIPNVTGAIADVATIIAFYVRQGTAANAPTQRIDAILVGTTWAQVTPTTAGPTINVIPASLTGFVELLGVPSAEQNYSVDGSNLTNDIIITPPLDFEISTGTGGGFVPTNPITLTQVGGTVNPTNIYVRQNAGALGPVGGNITNVSTGATTKNVVVTGNSIANEPATQGAITIGTVTNSSIQVNFTAGSGPNQILVVRATVAVANHPADGTTYTPNTNFGIGSNLGGNTYAVYTGASGGTVTVNNLSPSTQYHFALYEYDDEFTPGAENYLISPLSVGNATTLSSDGDYRSVLTGNWSDIATWQVRVADNWVAAATTPVATSNVFIQSGHTVTVDVAIAACNNLHINASTTVLAIGANIVEVNGKLRAYTGAAETALGPDGTFYTGQVSTNLVGSNCISTTSGVGKMSIVGNTRIVTFTGEWGNNPPLWDVEFAPSAGQTLTLLTGFKAQNITIASGTLLTTSPDMRPDGGAAGVGTLTVKSGSTLQFSNTLVNIQRIAGTSALSHFGTMTVEAGGILEFSGLTSNLVIGASVFALNGTVIYSGAGNQFFATKGGNSAGADPAVYTNVILSNSGTKTSGTFATAINGTLSLQGTASLVAGAAFGYGPAGVLEYKGSVAQTSGAIPAEWPVANGPFGLTIDNINGVTLNATSGRVINGALTLTNGILTTSPVSTLTLGATSTIPTTPTDANFVNGPVSKIGNTPFTFPIGKLNCGPSATITGYAPIIISNSVGGASTDQYTAEYIRGNASTMGGVALGLDHVSGCDYWTLNQVAGSSTLDITLTWNEPISNCSFIHPYVNNLPSLVVAHFDGANWNTFGGAGTATGTAAAGNVTWPGVSVFSPFVIGSIDFSNPLPITINYFTGTKNNGNHLLNWKLTCVSTPSATIEMERSIDGRNYNSIYSIFATALRCQQPFNYTDNAPAKGVNYYRLKMTDANGKITYSTVVSLINATKGIDMMNIAPNPIVNGTFNLKVSAAEKTQMEILITDMQGRVMQKQTVSMSAGFNTIPMNVKNLAGGSYQLSGYTADGRTRVLRFVIQ